LKNTVKNKKKLENHRRDLMLEQLIHEGEEIKRYVKKITSGQYIKGEEYIKWITKCIIFLERNYTNSAVTKRFIHESENSTDNNAKSYNVMLAIMKGLNESELDMDYDDEILA